MAKKKSSKKKKKFKFFRSIAKGIYYVLSAIYGVLDKIIITPVAKIMLLVQKPFKGSSKRLDRVLNNKIMLIIISVRILGRQNISFKLHKNLINITANLLFILLNLYLTPNSIKHLPPHH